jgi:hypothetical protein
VKTIGKVLIVLGALLIPTFFFAGVGFAIIGLGVLFYIAGALAAPKIVVIERGQDGNHSLPSSDDAVQADLRKRGITNSMFGR